MNLPRIASLSFALLLPSAGLGALGAQESASKSSSAIASGIMGTTTVKAPGISLDAVIDGALDDAVWSQATVLTGFSQYRPVDGRPAEDSTQVLVWYSPTAIYFGIRAYEAHGAVNATLAVRDRIFGDDNIQLFLDTYNDRRQAVMIAVNAFGVQADGAMIEIGRTGGGIGGGVVGGREPTDLAPDFVFQSKGQLMPWGFQVEIRIPF